MMIRVFNYLDQMGPQEFMGWATVILVIIFGFDFWRKLHV